MSVTTGQVVHIVLFQWKADASAEAVAAAISELKALKDKIPGILELTCGENFTDRSKGFTHGLVVRFVDRAALEIYGPHEAHQHVVQNFILPIRAEILALDYEI